MRSMDARCNLPMILRSAGAGGLLRVSRTFTERLGLTGEELDAEPLSTWIHPEDREALMQRLERGEGRVQARHRTASGDWVPFDWQVRKHHDGAVALGLFHQEREAASSTPASRTSPDRSSMGKTLDAMALIVEAKNPGMKCSILLTDPGREYITGGAGPSLPHEYNQAVEGLRIGPAVGSCGTATFWNAPVVVENIAEDPLWKDLRDAAGLAGVAACWLHPITATEGDVLGAMALYSPEARVPTQHEMDGLEIAARMVGLAVERESLEEQLRQAMKMEALGVLAGGIAHDFNNLLAAIMGNAELALTTLPRTAEEAPMLRGIVTASTSASELCNQMLAYAGRGALSVETLECNALIQELGGLLQVALSKKAELIFDLHDEPLGARADRSQLRQVIMNLITNAAEAIGNSEGRIVLGTSARTFCREDLELHSPDSELEPGDYVLLWVSDTGPGMNPTTQAAIFDPFFTTKSAGRGLGLAAVRGIVRGHQGAITLESAPGVGTTFTVLLPRVPVPHDDAPRTPASGPRTEGSRILVVDDDAEVREVLGRMLESADCRVAEASDGQEAIDLFRREADSIDCVLLDLSMPKLDGEETFHELRKIRDDVRVVLSSGFTEQEILDRFQGFGLAGVVQKPTPMPVLLAKIAEATGCVQR